MGGFRGTILVAAIVATALLLAGCGGEDGGAKIPQAEADTMKALAADIDAATASQECDVAQSSTTELRASVDSLPDETDPEIVRGLDAMVSRIDEQLNEECAETGTSEPTTTTTEPETTVPTTTTPTTTTTTTTTPEEDEDDEEEPEIPEQPPGEGGGPQGPKPTPPGQSGGGPPTGGLEEDE